MAFAPASTVPVPELIRRGYDRAKGLGHDGLDTVRAEHRALLARLRQTPEDALPEPAVLEGQPSLVFEPDALVGLYQPGAGSPALGALMAVLSGAATLCVDHPWLQRAVEALQSDGHDVRTAALWIATMTVMPKWGAPAAAPAEADALTPHQAAALRTALGAEGSALVAPSEALETAAKALGVAIVPG